MGPSKDKVATRQVLVFPPHTQFFDFDFDNFTEAQVQAKHERHSRAHSGHCDPGQECQGRARNPAPRRPRDTLVARNVCRPDVCIERHPTFQSVRNPPKLLTLVVA